MESEILQLDADDCFFCEPERWRVLFEGAATRVVVGAGPLCPGYVMLAPRAHVHTVAELSAPAFAEFIVVYDLIRSSLRRQYGSGYTAYEHGRTGSCAVLEARGDLSTFCHHAHRVIIPRSTHFSPDQFASFGEIRSLPTYESVRDFAGEAYVFYETATPTGDLSRIMLANPQDLPSQFMRRAITQDLGTGRNWNWREAPRLLEMIETVSALSGEFVGIGTRPGEAASENVVKRPLTITVDGFSAVGKTTVATELGRILQLEVFDSGKIFRAIAVAKLEGTASPSHEDIRRILDSTPMRAMRSGEIRERAAREALNHDNRRVYRDLLREQAERMRAGIFVGRDVWSVLDSADLSILLESDVPTRATRRRLEIARSDGVVVDQDQVAASLSADDERQRTFLPPIDNQHVRRVENGRRNLSATVLEILAMTPRMKLAENPSV